MEGNGVKHLMPRPKSSMSFRTSARLSAKTFQAVTVDLTDSLFALVITHSSPLDMTLGMEFIVGDGILIYLAIHMAMLPANQGKGVER